jgi:subtilisin-like proprotein convertase family protein
MTPASHYELSLEQADGRFDLERKRSQAGDAGDLHAGAAARFADDTVPSSRWWNGSASDLTIDQISASGAVMSFRARFGAGAPPAAVRHVATPNLAIPDNNAAGVRSTISVTEDVTLASIKVGLKIDHSWIGDLRATLRGRSSRGDWTLHVQDLAASDAGTLRRWGLGIGGAVAAPGAQLSESPGTAIPDNNAAGIERTLTNNQALVLGSVEVAAEIAHSWVGDLRIELVSPAGTVVLLRDQAGGSQKNLSTTWTAATTPALAALAGQPAAGNWRLNLRP